MDCYLATNLDILANGKLKSNLYKQNKKGYYRYDDIHNLRGEQVSASLPNTVIANLNVFCKVVYHTKKPSYILMTEELKLKNFLLNIDVHRVEKLPVLRFEN
jgi:hypothetical protein